MEPKELFDGVKKLAKQGKSVKEISSQLGFKTPFTFQSHLISASQVLGKPVPIYKVSRKGGAGRMVEQIKVKQRGKGDSYGANVPMEPLARAGIKAGATLSVRVMKGRIVLTAQ